jgi:hypothetical protein
MNQIDYPSDTLIAFRKALYYSDTEAMRRFASQTSDLFPRLLADHNWVVCDAAKKSSPEAVRVLIELGAEIDQQDSNGFTGLCWAVARENYDNAKMLLECGANPDVGCPIFSVATQNLRDPIAMAQLLLDHGADINQLFLVEGLPPRNVLSESVQTGLTNLVEFLKSRHAKLPDDAAGG